MLRSPTHLVGHGPTSSPLHIATTPNVHRLNFTTTTSAPATPTTNNNNLNHNNNNHFNGANSPMSHQSNGLFAIGSATATNNGAQLFKSSTNTNSSSTSSSSTASTPTAQATTRLSLFDSCHRKIRLIGGGPVAFLGGLVAKARRKERDGDQSSTDTKLYLEESVLERKLPDADLKALVDLPAGLDYNEWLASHTLALFEHVNLVYGTISEFCTTSGCQDMTGPGNRTYLWFDEKGKKTRVAAPQYIDYVMTFTQKTVSDESIFPTKYANEFPSSFESIARKILRLQFHVIAHLYAAHFKEIALLGLHTHLNLTFAHLTALHRRFNLIDEKETDVLRDLEVALRLTDDFTNTSSCVGASSIASTTTNNGSNNSVMSSSNNSSHSGSGGVNSHQQSSSCLPSVGGGDHLNYHHQHPQHRLLLCGTNDDNNLLNSGIAGRIDVVSSNLSINNIVSAGGGNAGLMSAGLVCDISQSSSSANTSPRHPICTQPEAMKGFNSDLSDLKHSDDADVSGNCIDGSTYFKGGINNSSQQCVNINNNHQKSSTATTSALYTTNSMLQQCNSRNSPNNSNSSSHTTTTA